jgi:peptidoglycan/LPS O-acetylase OafA/YrhL
LTSSAVREFSPPLHALRGIAAMAVLFFHWYQFFPSAAHVLRPETFSGTLLDPTVFLGFGWMGVPLFFVLSGYLLGGQVISQPLSGRFLRRFWLKRALRIYPAVWAELVLLLILGTMIDGLISKQGMESLPFQFLLWINLPPNMVQPINGVWWTLPVELGFYLFLPLLGLLVRFIGWRGLLIGGAVLTLAWRAIWFLTGDTDNFLTLLPVLDSLPGVLFTFMLGFSLNFLPVSFSPKSRSQMTTVSVISLLALMQWQLSLDAVYWTGHWILVVWPPLVAIPIAAIVYVVRDPLSQWRWLEHGMLVWLGHVSFGIYLWHFQVMRILVLSYPDAWGTPATDLLALIVAILSTLVLAALSYYYVEKPMMNWGKRNA